MIAMDKAARVAARYALEKNQYLHDAIAKALGWSDRDVKSMSLPALRDLVRPVNRALADEISHVLARGGHI